MLAPWAGDRVPLKPNAAEQPERTKNGKVTAQFWADASVINALTAQSMADQTAIIVKLTFMVLLEPNVGSHQPPGAEGERRFGALTGWP